MSPRTQRWAAASTSLGTVMLCMAALRAFGLADIPWLWVFSPWWLPLGMVALLMIGIGIVHILLGMLSYIVAFVDGVRG